MKIQNCEGFDKINWEGLFTLVSNLKARRKLCDNHQKEDKVFRKCIFIQKVVRT